MISVATWSEGAPGREIRTTLGSTPEVWMPYLGAGRRLEPTPEDGILRDLLCSWRMHFGRVPRGSVVTWRGAKRFVERVGVLKEPVGLVPSDAPTHAELSSGHVAEVRGVLWWIGGGPTDLAPLAEMGPAQGELW